MFSNQNLPKTCPRFYCEKCDYGTSKKSSFDEHLFTLKHKKSMIVNDCQSKPAQNLPENQKYNCQCGKIYKDNSGLWRHKKVCKHFSEKDIIFKILDDNSELRNMMLEIVKKGLCNNSNNTTNNSNNKSFNLQFFLNEQCKDAMNLSEFVSSIVPTMEDLETTGRLGYAEGISRIFIKKLDEVGTNLRPVHCTDLKREVLYIKEGDKWEKDDDTKTTLTKAIKSVSRKSANNILVWRDKNRGCTDSDSRKNDLYLNIVSNSMPGSTEEETEKNYNKIINKITKEVVVDKE